MFIFQVLKFDRCLQYQTYNLDKISWANPVYFPVWSEINNFLFVFFRAKQVYAHKHNYIGLFQTWFTKEKNWNRTEI